MSTVPSTTVGFADHQGGHRFALDHVAQEITAHLPGEATGELLVLALNPTEDDRRVVASAGQSAIRAAVSVAVAAGNTRAWAGAKGEAIVGVDIKTLPEIIRAAVTPAGITTVDVATVDDGDRPACFVMWLSRTPTETADESLDAARREILARLHQAVAVDRGQAEAAAETAARAAAAKPRPAAPTVDLLASLPDRGAFQAVLDELESEAAGLLVLAIDDIDTIRGANGSLAAEGVIRGVAERLSAGSRKGDVVARIADDTFAVLLRDVERHVAFEISKRLRAELAEPIEHDRSVLTVEFSVGLAHEAGLIDPDQLFGSATSAMREARQAGGARMLVAS
jgi:diguanylate cyclase (GGDEF)-like protein